MSATITFFPVGNGDMTLIKLNDSDETTILVDINIRSAADDDDDDTLDVAKELRKRLKKDGDKRPYVDVFLLSHPDKDHCAGLKNHFHLGSLDGYKDEVDEGEDKKIVIREIWSSPMAFRRASKNNTLSDNAKAFNKEAKRRVKVFSDSNDNVIDDGDKVCILGEDEPDNNGKSKTEGLEDILIKAGECFETVRGTENKYVKMCLLGPLPKEDNEDEEEKLEKNHSSVIIQFSIAHLEGKKDACSYLTGGDAGVVIWEKIWAKYKDKTDYLKYDLLLTPHHCSWRVLSHDSWSEVENPQVSDDAKSALSQSNDGAFIVSSSNPIKDDDNDPPCIGAKKEYVSIVGEDGFYCTEEFPNEKAPEPLEFTITSEGPQPPAGKKNVSGAVAGLAATRAPIGHG